MLIKTFIKIVLLVYLSFQVISSEKSESFKAEFTDHFIIQRLMLAQQVIHEGVEKFNKRNMKNQITLDRRRYILESGDYKLEFSYLDIIMKKVSVNGLTFNLVESENSNELKMRLKKRFSKRKETFYRLLIQPAYAESEEAFDLILSAVLHMTNYTSRFFSGSHIEESLKVFDEIEKKNSQCQNLKASGKKDLSGGDEVSNFINKVLYSSQHEELESFKKDSRELLLSEGSFSAKAQEQFEERVSDLRSCGVLGYLVAKHEKNLSGNLLNEGGRSLRNIQAYAGGSDIKSSSKRAREFCRNFNELTSCLVDISIFGKAIEDSFNRDSKSLRESLKKPSQIYKSNTLQK